ncbi:MmgE/PrpD family protein [Roseomonas sp. BN140053]|uniref:MmgE/PrpD family protein n=1 Tax=Roseomonas sp. BN140053 TaxID=3391898 RepID=UPI0039E850DC
MDRGRGGDLLCLDLRRVGPGHYHRGWHGTGTIGAFAAAASRLLRLDEAQIAQALALAAAQSGGLPRGAAD